jgi:hypothetical protein
MRLTRTIHFQEKITEGDGALESPTWRGRTVFLRSLFQKERPDPPLFRAEFYFWRKSVSCSILNTFFKKSGCWLLVTWIALKLNTRKKSCLRSLPRSPEAQLISCALLIGAGMKEQLRKAVERSATSRGTSFP